MTHPAPGGRSGARQLLRQRAFARPFAANLLSAIGERLHHLAGAIVVFQATRSALAVGVFTALQFGAPLVLSPVVGTIIDRSDRRRLLQAAQALKVMGGLVVAAGVTGGVTSLPLVFLGTGLLGAGQGIAVPAWQTYLPALVARRDLAEAVALNSVAFNLSRAAGPLLGAAIVASAAPLWAFLTAAGTAVCFGLVLSRSPDSTPPSRRASGSGPSLLRTVAARPLFWRPLVGMAALGVVSDPAMTLGPAIATLLGGGEVAVGALAAGFGLGAVVSAPLARRSRTRLGELRSGVMGLLLSAAGLLLLAAAPRLAVAYVAVVLTGSGYLIGAAALTTVLHLHAGESLRGRLMVLWSVAFMGVRPLAALLHGAVADVFGVRVAVLVAMVVALLGAGVAWQAGTNDVERRSV